MDGRSYRAHKELLFFASPFFEAALSGDWAETGRPQSMSSVITISQPPTIPRTDSSLPPPTSEATLVQLESDPEHDGFESDARASDSEVENGGKDKERARMESLSKLESPAADELGSEPGKGKRRNLDVENTLRTSVRRRTRRRGPDAVIVLKEEKVSVWVAVLFNPR
jgi:hypothetical protein